MNHKSLNQLVCAATINTRFRETLLNDPAKAIANGYFGQSFALTQEERDLVLGIRAKGLEDFAAQVYRFVSGNGNRMAPSRHGRKKEPLPSADSLVDLYRAPALAHA
jgi:hypothetical protein